MSAAGLPPSDVPLALVSFNVGVEIGQLAFVALVLLLERGVRAFRVSWPRPVELLPAYAVGSLGAFWLIQRVTLIRGAEAPEVEAVADRQATDKPRPP